MKQEEQGKSIEDITREDGSYEQGLLTLKNQIKQRSEAIKNIDNDTTLTDLEKRGKKLPLNAANSANERQIKEYQTTTP